jgi:hypothetical protein
MLTGMITVTDAEAAALRAVYEQRRGGRGGGATLALPGHRQHEGGSADGDSQPLPRPKARLF